MTRIFRRVVMLLVAALPSKQMRVFYRRSEGKDGNYAVDHTAAMFVFDRVGRIRRLVSRRAGANALAHDIKILLSRK